MKAHLRTLLLYLPTLPLISITGRNILNICVCDKNWDFVILFSSFGTKFIIQQLLSALILSIASYHLFSWYLVLFLPSAGITYDSSFKGGSWYDSIIGWYVLSFLLQVVLVIIPSSASTRYHCLHQLVFGITASSYDIKLLSFPIARIISSSPDICYYPSFTWYLVLFLHQLVFAVIPSGIIPSTTWTSDSTIVSITPRWIPTNSTSIPFTTAKGKAFVFPCSHLVMEKSHHLKTGNYCCNCTSE